MSQELEEGLILNLDWQKLEKAVAGTKGIIPVVVQEVDSREVILVAYINQQAFEESLKRKKLVLWSSSRNELWIKGATSGETFALLEAYVNCEQNSLLFIVRPERGGICHTKNSNGEPRNCYYRRIDINNGKSIENLDVLKYDRRIRIDALMQRTGVQFGTSGARGFSSFNDKWSMPCVYVWIFIFFRGAERIK